MLAEAMSLAGASFAEIQRIGVTVGPGSFTGLRVGLAFAKGLAIALGVPCVGVSSLQALAASVPDAEVLAAIDAKRGQLYLQLFSSGAPESPAEAVLLEQAAAWVRGRRRPGRLVAVGSGAPLIQPLLGEGPGRPIAAPDPLAVARLAGAAPEPSGPPRPLYLRAPDARLPA